MNPLCRLLGLERPIVQAPMAGVQLGDLAVAVSEAGGLGSLPCALLSPEAISTELSAIRARTDRPINVNFFSHRPPTPDAERERAWRAALRPYYEALGLDPDEVKPAAGRAPFSAAAAEVLETLRPAVVSFHFGLPDETLLARVRGCGARILATATTVEEARWLDARGVDAIVAQGLEAGGHRGMFLSGDVTTQSGTFALVPQVVRAVGVPVIAAGGVADARGVAAALALGAAGVQVGTAFLLCPEAKTTPLHRAALASPAAAHTALTNLLTGGLARGIVNRLIRELGPVSTAAPAFPLAAAAIAPLRAAAEARGSGDFSSLWAGQNATGCQAIAAGRLTLELAGAS